MSSLRLALKQSLKETGHLAPKEKKKKRSLSRKRSDRSQHPLRRQNQQHEDPPRKRGRPRKHPKPDDSDDQGGSGSRNRASDEDGEGGHDSESHMSSENGFSYDSEDSHDGDEVEDGEDDERNNGGPDQEGVNDTSGHHASHEEEEGEIEENDAAGEGGKMKKSNAFDADGGGEVGDGASSGDDDNKKHKKLKKQLKHSAAHKIQSQWKKKRDQAVESQSAPDEASGQVEQTASEANAAVSSNLPADSEPHKDSSNKEAPSSSKKKRRDKHSQASASSNGGTGRSKTVPPPAPEILEWARGLSEKKWRKHITSGLRVKVRFATKVKRDGKVIKKKKWYGGLVSAVSREGSKIKIKYDDGTSEVSKFPDKDVVVDDESNGQHLVPADRFLPPPPPPVEDEEIVGEEQTETVMEEATRNEVTAINDATPKHQKVKPDTADKDVDDSKVQPMDVDEPDTSKYDSKTPEVVEDMAADESKPEESEMEKLSMEPAERSNTPSKPDDSVVPNDTATTDEPPQMIQLTSVATLPVFQKNEMKTPPADKVVRPAHISIRDQGSPEEGELSPGLTFSKDNSNREPFKPIEMSSLDPDYSVTKEPSTDTLQTTSVALPDLSLASQEDGPAFEEKTIELHTADEEQKAKEPTPKLSLTIRIPNVKSGEKESSMKEEEKGVESQTTTDVASNEAAPEEPQPGEDEDDTTKEPEPTHEKSEATTDQQPATSRKRALSDPPAEEDAPPTKKRIHLKRPPLQSDHPQQKHDDTQTNEAESISEPLLHFKAASDSENPSPPAESAKSEELGTSVKGDGAANEKDSKTTPVTLKKSLSEIEDAEDAKLSAPSLSIKLKRKRESNEKSTSPRPRSPRPRATSPKLRNPRRSPANTRRSPATIRAESPAQMSSEPNPEVDTPKPMSKPFPKSANDDEPATAVEAAADDSSIQEAPLIITGSKNSAFERKQPVKGSEEDELRILAPLSTSNGDEAVGAEGKPSTPKLRERSKTGSESNAAARSGRRAAQAAKEKINTKNDTPAMEGKKKKKRRKREGKESDEEESETSEDDRQWVQCDSCSKWRILPSSVKVSSLPKHWYCSMNEYDPKRNNCDAAEQTPKQVAKERKRAKKRAKRMEQAELEAIPEDSRKEQRGRDENVKEPTMNVSNGSSTKEASSKEASNAVGESKSKSKRSSPVTPVPTKEEPAPVDTGPETQKEEKKAVSGKKGKVQEKAGKVQEKAGKVQEKVQEKTQEVAEGSEAATETSADTPKPKPGRRRGRPRNAGQQSGRGSAQENRDEGDNVEWVQCEKCNKWRKLPPHICADELPDVWYCSLNTWNPDSASCDSPEDKADALHQDVGSAIPGNPSKFSYRGLIFGTGRKQNRPMSERTRAAESLFASPVDDTDNPYPVVMYAKSSAFLPRTSNFTKSNAVEEKCPTVFDVMSNSELWAELHGINQPIPILSASFGNPTKKNVTFESLPDDMKKTMRDIVLHTLGSATLTSDAVIYGTKNQCWENLPPAWLELKGLCTPDIVINTLLELVRGGVLEMACSREADRPMSEWVPKYRQVRSRRSAQVDEAMKASRCMKISKPWKQRESDSQEWISGKSVLSA